MGTDFLPKNTYSVPPPLCKPSMKMTWEIFHKKGQIRCTKRVCPQLAMISPQNFRIVVKQLAHNENGYRDVLKEIFMSESNLIVLDCEKKILEEVLKQCQQVSRS